MPNTQYKRRDLKHKSPSTPPEYNVRGGAPLERWPFQQILKAQDTVAESARRQVISQQMQGQTKAWLVPDTDPSGQASQTHPDKDDDREVWAGRFALAPGSILEFRTLYLPSGATQSHPSMWEDDGGFGQVRVALSWDNGASTDTSEHVITQEPSPLEFNAQPGGINGAWPSIRYGFVPFCVPGAAWFGDSEWTKWSEWTTVTATVNHRGSPRLIHATLTELPRLYVDDHNNSGTASLHVYPDNVEHPDLRPQTDSEDGATYEEHRFGTHRALDVARHQGDRAGPVVFSWSAYLEGDGSAGVGGNPGSVATASFPPTAMSNATSTPKCLWNTAITAWSAAAPGFAVPGHYSTRFAENDTGQILPGGTEACIPIRVNAYARVTSGTGYIKIQTTDRSAAIWAITGAGFAWHTFTAFIECSRAGDDTGVNGMLFAYQDGGAGTVHCLYAYVERCVSAES